MTLQCKRKSLYDPQMRNTLGIRMDHPLKGKPYRNKPPIIAPAVTNESKSSIKRTQTVMPTLRARRGSFDSAVGVTNSNSKSVCSREKTSLSDSVERKTGMENRKCSFVLGTPSKCDGKPPISRESKYSINRISLASRQDSDLKPILKTSNGQSLITIDDLTSNDHEDRDSNGKFCYRLPVSKPSMRKSVSFREETDDVSEILQSHVRRYSSPNLQMVGLNSNLSKMVKTMKT